jgi:4-diphosphocytidyl-2-C-methyl-D-erythritol kinase
MRIREQGGDVEILAPAKVNLFLEVLGRRADGFHELETLLWPVAMYDTLAFRTDETSAEITLECSWGPYPSSRVSTGNGAQGSQALRLEELPEGSDNLVVRAIRLLRERAGVRRGARLRLVKRIPLSAGLAGGSSNAAAALVAANLGWGLGWPRSALGQIAAELGSDVPFFLAGGPAVCRGRGEQVELVAHRMLLHLVIVRPPVGLSTADVYRACLPARDPRPLSPLLQALGAGNVAKVGRLLHNRLQPAAASLCPWIDRLAREFARLNTAGHQMSGSGSSYFGLCHDARQARRAAQQLRERGFHQVFATSGCA